MLFTCYNVRTPAYQIIVSIYETLEEGIIALRDLE